ncbi:YjcZ family sporulation protein [Lysinibacillus yapensis]|uniref:YjcZ family sporulation protein n=2 Tax=Ureibacillus yapensis TaxID=2304605 RepID=A0A396SUL7_9BACL|nr:YjcZ family sporulation protein [Lysinibacillus yapensis]
MPAYDMCEDHGGHKGSYFVLIVVLFILLIIVGKCYL